MLCALSTPNECRIVNGQTICQTLLSNVHHMYNDCQAVVIEANDIGLQDDFAINTKVGRRQGKEHKKKIFQ